MGFLASFTGCLVLWKTKKQPNFSLSTAEAEYKSPCNLTSELIWLCQLYKGFLIYKSDSPILIYKDNQECIKSSNCNSNINNQRMKHVGIQLHFVKEAISNSTIKRLYTPTNNILAYFLTELMSRPFLVCSLDLLGILHLGVRGALKIRIEFPKHTPSLTLEISKTIFIDTTNKYPTTTHHLVDSHL
ncbi:hypothetical protein O181_009460 [Austropuccinia psidii MF-1]|uniref:Copia protein n=1 Tax=Austropuccinia psidii MF-1 TaxID=1389203 RepID=A0A9Q3BRC4_9BASI|nr:hypothetical protein [Austropuccinia psidii MF-1]